MEKLSIEELGNVQDVIEYEQSEPKVKGCSKCGNKQNPPIEEKKSCSTCGDKNNLTPGQSWMLGLAIYILFASVYGTIKIVENIVSYF
jgi:hypothetical protein